MFDQGNQATVLVTILLSIKNIIKEQKSKSSDDCDTMLSFGSGWKYGLAQPNVC